MRGFRIVLLTLFVFSPTYSRKADRRSQRGRSTVGYQAPHSGQRIRLGGTRNSNVSAGNVEVFLRNRWGIICDDKWDLADANVVCRQLGFRAGAVRPTVSAEFGVGEWESTDILLDDVACVGNEGNVLACTYLDQSNCQSDETAGVVCKPNTGCPDGWLAGPSSCYLLSDIITTRQKFAENKCSAIGGHLVKIENEAENHFLSVAFANSSAEPIITAGIKEPYGWVWRTVEMSQTSSRQKRHRRARPSQNRRAATSRNTFTTNQRISSVSIHYAKWFPDKSQGVVDVGYMFWADDSCERTQRHMKDGFRYLCERPREEMIEEPDRPGTHGDNGENDDCYVGIGLSYRGTMSRTEKGTPCIDWALSNSKHTPTKLPNKGLEDGAFCRNPDADTRPWCYVNTQGGFGFCPVPECSSETDVAITTTVAPSSTTTEAPECTDNKFYCSIDAKCISSQWHCDYDADCTGSQDEKGCEYVISQFAKKDHRTLNQAYVKEDFVGITNETCAKFCIGRLGYVCRVFSYHPAERKCKLSDVVEKGGQKIYDFSFKHYVFVLTSQKGNCEGGFTCDNGRCVARRHVCDQSDNCGDLSDEKDCGQASNVEVRLADGDEDSGRVEIKYLGEWGVICDDNWDSSDASVICQMLGYKGFSAQAVSGSRFGSGNGKFLRDEVNCTGTEKSIVDCIHPDWKVHNCRLHEVAGVSCLQKKAGSIDLVNGTEHSVSAGRVEITRNGLTGTICDDSWDDNDAIVVCKMKGFKFGEAVTGGYFSPGTGPIWLDDVECTGEETKLSDCRSSSWGVSNCGHAEDAGVICSNDLPPLPDLPTESPHIAPTLELVDGHDEHSGRVEMVVNNQQGTICDDQWDDNDAAVVCRMLGYKRGTAKVNGHFGPGSSTLSILLDDVDCVGTEASILDCRHVGLGVHNCVHGEDAGVICSNEQAATNSSGSETNFRCGLRPMEHRSRKKREEPEGLKELAPPPKFEAIIGGFTASKGMYPWQVGVHKLEAGGVFSHWCGGTILSEHWILSAAHCFEDLTKGHILVRTGDHDTKIQDVFEQEFELEHMIPHPRYDLDNFDYDLALLKVKRKNGSGIKFSDEVQAACLPDDSMRYVPGVKCHISGWGETEFGFQNLLKSALVPIISDVTCQRLYKTLTPNMVCAGYLEGGIDSCAGDSGGPLVCEVDRKYYVMGATSFGAGCAEPNAPGVYARVTAFLPWIRNTMQRFA